MMTHALITPHRLEQSLQQPRLRIVDCRWILNQPGEGRRHYDNGHIPGAVHLDADVHLAAKVGPGRHPIPQKRDFQKMLLEIGVDPETHVIAYDDGLGMPAPRLWWLLHYYGHDKVSVLDGGWRLWLQEGRPIQQEAWTPPVHDASNFVPRAKRKWVVDKEAVDSMRDDPEVLLIDARNSERYRGESEPIDPKAGHIPGALNLPYSQLLHPETGCFLPPDRLQEKLREIGYDKSQTVICYCGSGITACTDIFALHLAGVEAKLYEGSWSDWSRDSNLPVAPLK